VYKNVDTNAAGAEGRGLGRALPLAEFIFFKWSRNHAFFVRTYAFVYV